MVRKVNKGVSFVEVLIALAIFMLMMIPLVTGLTSGMKTTTAAKELQYRNEFAQNLMESVKEVPIDVLKEKKTAYFDKMGSSDVSIDAVTEKLDGIYPYEKYDIKGKTYLGTEHTEYSYAIEVSSYNYADAEKLGGMNPNNLSSGVVEDLDKTKVALISANLSNYDTPAYEALLTRKMSELRKRQDKKNNDSDPTNDEVYDPINDVKLFDNDTGNRVINIAVEGDSSDGYDVSCTLYYSDNCNELSENSGVTIGKAAGMVEYMPYQQHFDELPNIYLMYNVCVYNNRYANDYITYDLSGLKEDSQNVNVFVIETAANYSSDVVRTNNEIQTSGGENLLGSTADVLYRKAGDTKRDNATIGMALSSKNLTEDKREHFHVYHNMTVPAAGDEEWKNHAKNIDVQYDSTIATTVKNLFNDTSHVYEDLSQVYNDMPQVCNLNKAQQGNRGLYEVKVWMEEGDVDVNTLKSRSPIVQGTRGGGEID